MFRRAELSELMKTKIDCVANKLEEYKQLRTEIVLHMQLQCQYTIATISATALPFGIAFATKNPNPYLFLAPLSIIFPCIFNNANRSEAILRTGTYIQVFHEADLSILGWETRLYKLPQTLRGTNFIKYIKRFLSTSSVFFIGLLSIALFLVISSTRIITQDFRCASPAIYLIAVTLVLLLIYAQIQLLLIPSRRDRYIDAWKMLREEESKVITNELPEENQ